MKPNNCELIYICGDMDNDCVYSDGGNHTGCSYYDVDYYDTEICKSKVAQANRLTLALNSILKEEKNEIQSRR